MPRTCENQIRSDQIQAIHSPALQSTAQAPACHHATQHRWWMAPRDLPAMASLRRDPPQYVSLWCTDGREREVEQLQHYEEMWTQRLEGGEAEHVMNGLPHHLGPW